MTSCLAEETLQSWLAGALEPVEADTVCAHVHECARCQSVLDRQTEYSGLRRWLEHGPETVANDLDAAAVAGMIDRIHLALSARNEEPDLLPGGSSPAALRAEPIGDTSRIASFRLLNELGRGGMGIVYRAWDESLQRLVALKVLRPGRTEETDRLRLVREARVAAQFRHDHAVMVHAVACPDDGLPYLVMEYVLGSTLAQLIDVRSAPSPGRSPPGSPRSPMHSTRPTQPGWSIATSSRATYLIEKADRPGQDHRLRPGPHRHGTEQPEP